MLSVLWNIFTSHNFFIHPKAVGSACSAGWVIMPFPRCILWQILMLSLVLHLLYCPGLYQECSGSDSHPAGCSACWVWVKQHLLCYITSHLCSDLDVAEQFESKEKVLKKPSSLGFIYKVIAAAAACADTLGLWAGCLEDDWVHSCCTANKYTEENQMLAPASTCVVNGDAVSN